MDTQKVELAAFSSALTFFDFEIQTNGFISSTNILIDASVQLFDEFPKDLSDFVHYAATSVIEGAKNPES